MRPTRLLAALALGALALFSAVQAASGGLSAPDVLARLVLAFGLYAAAAFEPGRRYALGIGVVADAKISTTPATFDPRDVSDKVTELGYGNETPLDQLLRKLNLDEQTDSVAFEWPEEDLYFPVLDTVTAASGAGAAGATVNVTVGNVAMWRPNDIAINPATLGTAAALLVVAVNTAASTISVAALPSVTSATQVRQPQAYGTVPAFAVGTKLANITNSKTEFDAPSVSRILTGDMAFNQVQTFDEVVRASDHRQRTKAYGNQAFKDHIRRASVNARLKIERAYWFAPRSVTTGTNGELRWTAGGLFHFINQQITYSAASLTEGSIVDWTRSIFAGNSGSKRRFLFCGSLVAADLAKVQLNKLTSTPDRDFLGVRTTELRGMLGGTNLEIIWHPEFDRMGLSDIGAVVDIKQLKRRWMQKLSLQKMNYRETGVADGDGVQYIEKSGLEMRNLAAHWLIRRTA